MNIQIHSSKNENFLLKVAPVDDVLKIHEKIKTVHHEDSQNYKIFFNNVELSENITLTHIGLKNNDTLFLKYEKQDTVNEMNKMNFEISSVLEKYECNKKLFETKAFVKKGINNYTTIVV